MSLYFYNIFTMTGGTIVNNKAGPSGAGVKLVATNQSPGIETPYVDYVFTYPAGAISGNTPKDFLYKNIPVLGYY
jgi:hypothetical protein